MKIGSAEGTPEEIRDFFQAYDLKVDDYLEKPQPPLAKHWFIIPATITVLILATFFLWPPSTEKSMLFRVVMTFITGGWLTIALQVAFKNAVATVAAAIAIILVTLVTAGLIEPKDAMDAVVKELKP